MFLGRTIFSPSPKCVYLRLPTGRDLWSPSFPPGRLYCAIEKKAVHALEGSCDRLSRMGVVCLLYLYARGFHTSLVSPPTLYLSLSIFPRFGVWACGGVLTSPLFSLSFLIKMSRSIITCPHHVSVPTRMLECISILP